MIVKDLLKLGFSQAGADLIDYIYLNPNCSVKDICRDTNFAQPEVCVLVNNLRGYLLEEKHTQSRGRPYMSYTIDLKTLAVKKLTEIMVNYDKAYKAAENLRDLTSKH